MNHLIRITPIRVIGADGEQVGVIETAEALRMANEAGLDLVEISPDVRPPVSKIMDNGKFKYEQSKQSKTKGAKETKTICPYCSVGCGIVVHTKDGKLVSIEGDADHPINEGTL
ncbi:MAG: translation initiation factor IF-3, partial [Phycisphaerales bacterium]